MYKFVIQSRDCDNNMIPCHDFGFSVIDAVKYNNWYNCENDYSFVLSETILPAHKDYIPVGSVEFVLSHMRAFHGISNVRPINIPEELFPYAKRFVKNIDRPDVWKLLNEYGVLFLKSSDNIKEFSGICTMNSNLPLCNFFVSEVVDLQSEWRCFVRKGQLLDMRNYSGDFTVFPDVETINKMIEDYVSAPPAYTLDIGINNKNETVVIEAHNFFSCGTYGFSDYTNYLGMLISAYKWQVQKSGEGKIDK